MVEFELGPSEHASGGANQERRLEREIAKSKQTNGEQTFHSPIQLKQEMELA